MNPLPKQAPFWLLLFGIAALAAGLEGLLADSVATPVAHGLSGRLDRAAQPAAYWLLTAAYLIAGPFFLRLAYLRHREPAEDGEPAPPRPASPPWARALAWLGAVSGTLLVAGGVWAHFALGPIVSLPFVAILGGGGLLIGLACVGYLVTGRAG